LLSTPDLVCLAPAKVNRFLHIIGRRADGYHELQTFFQFIDLADELSFTLRDDTELRLLSGEPAIPPEQNLALRAARLLRSEVDSALPGVDISVLKQIPIGGGLGGGSSDAATVLLALNRLWELNWSNHRLAQLALQLGADVPFFVEGRAAFAEGVGERLTPVELPSEWLLIVQPEVLVSTARVFEGIDLTACSHKLTMARHFASGGVSGRNDCEPAVRLFYPEVGRLLNWLGQFGAARLSGTGGCGFVAFPDQAQAAEVAEQVPTPWQAYVVRTSNLHPIERK